MKKRILQSLIVIVGISIFLPVGFHLMMPQVSRCYWIDQSDEFRKEGGVYFSSDTPDWVQDSLLVLVQRAKKRNASFWGEMQSEPEVVFCFGRSHFDRFGAEGNPATTWLTPIGAYVVLNSGAFNVDVISHEMCHAELLKRLGWFSRDRKIPAWFDEGLAMQLDRRKRYGAHHYFGYTNVPALDKIATPETFWKGSKEEIRFNYIVSKYEIGQWLGNYPKTTLLNFVEKMHQGLDFEEAFDVVRRRQEKF